MDLYSEWLARQFGWMDIGFFRLKSKNHTSQLLTCEYHENSLKLACWTNHLLIDGVFNG